MKDLPCACRPIRVEDLDELVWQQVTDLLEEPELIGAELERRRQESLKSDPLQRRRGQPKQELKRVEQQIDKLRDVMSADLKNGPRSPETRNVDHLAESLAILLSA